MAILDFLIFSINVMIKYLDLYCISQKLTFLSIERLFSQEEKTASVISEMKYV